MKKHDWGMIAFNVVIVALVVFVFAPMMILYAKEVWEYALSSKGWCW